MYAAGTNAIPPEGDGKKIKYLLLLAITAASFSACVVRGAGWVPGHYNNGPNGRYWVPGHYAR